MNVNSEAQSLTFNLVNSCSSQIIWPAILGNGALSPLPDGIMLPPGQRYKTAPIPLPWSGRVWPRQLCSEAGDNCLVGDCGSSVCSRSSTNTTLFEMTINSNEMFYDISLGIVFLSYPRGEIYDLY